MVPPRRLGLGASRWYSRGPWLEARTWLPELRLGRVQRGTHPLRSRPRFADVSIVPCELRGMDPDVSVGKPVRARLPLCRAPLYPSAVACVDRLSRAARSLHARKAMRLFREQPARHARATGIRDPQPARFSRLCPGLLGAFGRRRTASYTCAGRRRTKNIFWI